MKDRMVILGNTRIRLSNIKNYGISSETRYRQKIYKREFVANRFGATVDAITQVFLDFNLNTAGARYEYEWTGEWYDGMSKKELEELNGATLYLRDDGKIGSTRDKLVDKPSIQEYREKYLYITTFQNDNFVFWESEVSFDIQEKLKEIDHMFS